MKRINITRLATAAGVASVLAMSSLASAADQPAKAPAITDPATLMKFDNVRVVNATPEQIAAAQNTAASSGMKAYADANGTLRAPTQADVDAEAASASAKVAAPAAAKRSTFAARSASTTITTAKGIQLEAATAEDMSYAVAVVGKDGKLKQMCIEGQPGDQAALAKAESAQEVDTHEK
jgi:hypothetical protein